MKIPVALAFSYLSLVQGLAVRRTEQAPYTRLAEDHLLVDDEYIVTLREGHTLEAHFEFLGKDLSTHASKFVRIEAINSYSVRIDAETLHNLIRYDPGVIHVEHNQYVQAERPVHVGEHVDAPHNARGNLFRRWKQAIRTNAGWGLQAISAWGKLATPILDNGPAEYLVNAGAGVNVYVVDTGIRITHQAFNGDASNFKGLLNSPYVNASNEDSDGHGTHVSGIIKSVAPGVKLINVKVLGPQPALDQIAKGISDVVEDHLANKKSPPVGWRGSVINMSLQTANSTALRGAIASAYAAGIPIFKSAGNSNVGDGTHPCGFTGVYCVASADNEYTKSVFSNYGSEVNIIAPGTDIFSASNLADNRLVSMSGTSMASPHAAGFAAIIVGYEGIHSDVDKVFARVTQNAQKDIITGFDGNPATVNLFLNTGIKNPSKAQDAPYLGAPAGVKETTEGSEVVRSEEPEYVKDESTGNFEGPEPGLAG